ncbi:MAG: PAS domain-containing sensor histidine kinase [SAR324 cluster bacterium]|nr:PAS domain-containing sensor histidine kinase [SAR324 cluster bacterium]
MRIQSVKPVLLILLLLFLPFFFSSTLGLWGLWHYGIESNFVADFPLELNRAREFFWWYLSLVAGLFVGGGLVVALALWAFSTKILKPLKNLVEANHFLDSGLDLSRAIVPIKDAPQGVVSLIMEHRNHLIESFIKETNRAQGVFNALQEAIFIFDKNAKIIEVNFSAVMLLNQSTKDYQGNGVGFLLAQNSECPKNWWQSNQYSGAVDSFEVVMKAKSGEEIPVVCSSSMLIDNFGEFSGMVLTARSLSLQKAQAEEIHLLQEMVKQSPIPLVLASISGIVKYANQAFVEKRGGLAANYIGLDLQFIESELQGVGSYWDKDLTGRFKKEIQGKGFYVIDGVKTETSFFEQVTASLIQGQNEASILISFEDIDQLKTIQNGLEEMVEARVQELKKAYKDLKSLEKLKDEFLATISHELKTPLSSIIGYSEAFCDMQLEPEQVKKFGGIILGESERLLALVQDLLDHTSLISGRLSMQRSSQQFDDLVARSCNSIHALINEKKLEIMVKPSEIDFAGDGLRIIQVLVNLLGNATKFAPYGSRIELKVTKEAQGFTVLVQDQGSGVPKELESAIFESFRQHRSHGSEIKGTGLGLSISKKIIEAHGGKIWAESSNQGGKIYFWLPYIGEEQA